MVPDKNLGPADKSIVCLTSSLVVKMLTVLVSIISNLQLFLLKTIMSIFFFFFFFFFLRFVCLFLQIVQQFFSRNI